MTSFRLLHSDCREVLRDLPEASIDACVTDPPYGIGFMGREWDTFAPGTGKHRRLMHPRERVEQRMRRFQEWTSEWATC